MEILAWVAGAGGVGLALAVAILAWRLGDAKADRDVAIVEAVAAEKRADDIDRAAQDERRRRDRVVRDLRSQLETVRDGCADLAARHPELAREYVREQLRELAAPALTGAHAVVPPRSAPRGPGGTDDGTG